MILKGKKVLMVSEVITNPHDTGNRHRVYGEICKLRELGCTIDFLYIAPTRERKLGPMQEFFGKDHFYFMKMKAIDPKFILKEEIRKFLDVRGISKKLALKYNIDEWYREEIGKKVLQLLRNNKYDVVWVQYLFYSKLLECLSGDVVKVIDLHDRFSGREKIFQKNNKVPSYFYTSVRQERKGLARADYVLAIQEQEAEFFKKILKGYKTKVITLGDVLTLKVNAVSQKKVIGFIGGESPLNIEGILWFINNVIPLIKKSKIEYQVWIAGDVCKNLADSLDYIKLGRIEDVEKFYRDVRVNINPVRGGTGLNIKSIEAIGHTKPLITTSVGAKGMNAEFPIFKVADNPNVFCDYIIKLMEDDAECLLLRDNCIKFIKDYNNKNFLAIRQIFERGN